MATTVGTTKNTSLTQELKFFEAHKHEYHNLYPDKFVVIKGEEFLGAFPDAETAFRAGTERWGRKEFLIRHVVQHESAALSPPILSKRV